MLSFYSDSNSVYRDSYGTRKPGEGGSPGKPCNAASLKREGKDSFAWALLACIDFFVLQGLMAQGEAAAVIRGVEGGKISK